VEGQRFYAAIDLKAFYASAECVARGLDPLTTNLVVADSSRTDKTICLAVSPSLKAMGVPSRGRLFEVKEIVRNLNIRRQLALPNRQFSGSSFDAPTLQADPSLSIDFLIAPPRMAEYLRRSAEIYAIYLRHIAPEDMHIYSIDEVFIDLTPYLRTYGLTPRQLTHRLVQDVWQTTGITATAGIGTNLYLSKIAMDILAKRAEPDETGARIAELDELGYRQQLWAHRPLTDFWRIGRRTAAKLEKYGMYTMGDVAECSIGKPDSYHNEHLLYRLFGVNAELLIDHAWGWESCTIPDIKAYKPKSSSLSSGQVLHRPYTFAEARLIVREMTELLALDLVEKQLVTDQLVLTVGYDVENLQDPLRRSRYRGAIYRDFYGRDIPVHAHGSEPLGSWTSSSRQITDAMMTLFDRIVNRELLVRRVTLAAGRIRPKAEADSRTYVQMDLFTDQEAQMRQEREQAREARRQQTELQIKRRFGKNAILRGMNLKQGATTIERNRQIGGHKA